LNCRPHPERGVKAFVDVHQQPRPPTRVQCKSDCLQQGVAMKALMDLFSTDYGLFSIAIIVFTIFMAVWFFRFFNRKMAESEALGEK
jgi:hypothetical protein